MTIEQALQSATDTRALVIGRGVLKAVPQLFAEHFPGKKALIVADTNTWKAAGKALRDMFKRSDVRFDPPFIFTDEELHAEFKHIGRLTAILGKTEAIPVAVGSGTINDLIKFSSYCTNRQYICVATAASVDGYTSYGASITAHGAKKTFNCPAPQVCVADTDVIANAPSELNAAGYADLFSKVTAGADWILADKLEIEPINKKAWNIVQNGLQDALSDPVGVSRGEPTAIGKLIEGLMMSGFAMQAMKSSRPASGAEHYLSHLWDMENHRFNGKPVSHGFQVSIGTVTVTALYEKVLQYPFQSLDIQSVCSQWYKSIKAMDKVTVAQFGNSGFLERCLNETHAKYVTPTQLAGQLKLLVSRWDKIRKALKAQLLPLSTVTERLQQVGAPTTPEQIGITTEKLRSSIKRAPFIRSRYTILDLLQRTNAIAISFPSC
ncbi:MAG: sn-glycerol-1-phosphate dehydrogenase [Tannerella sp.]|jgi:glycerol-1-phosphate dehydrogenase [NAD(P)+]|nr:sn-glycerol-1-phosphate dehydrogenase [Tannerella sp.]